MVLKPGRNYYTELAQSTPDNTVVLTLGCAKYRFNQHDFGDIALLACSIWDNAMMLIRLLKLLAR